MSEYQYYRFEAIDRPLTAGEQAALRQYSSRATINSRRFVVDYSWGSFKGDAGEWMERYFDAFLYRANWGTRELRLRLPRTVLPLESATRYCTTDAASARGKGDHIILEFHADEEDRGWIDEGDDTLDSLLPVRADLAEGDLRALYIGWLLGVQLGELDEAETEPPCPPGLGDPGPALGAFAEFLLIDPDLFEAAATGSPDLAAPDDAAFERWVKDLPGSEKTAILLRLARGTEAHVRAELLARFRESRSARAPATQARPRTVGELLAAAKARAEKRQRREAEMTAREKARREREAMEARERRLASTARREAEAWREVDTLIAIRQARSYDEAVALLVDLHEVCVRAGREAEATRRITRIRDEHFRKRSLIERIRASGLPV